MEPGFDLARCFLKKKRKRRAFAGKSSWDFTCFILFLHKNHPGSARIDVEIVSSLKQKAPILRKYHSIFEGLTRVYYEVQEATIDCDLNC